MMSRIEKYRPYFTKDYLMGPNSFLLLDEMIRRKPEDASFDRTLDLGCGAALTSLFIGKETDARTVFAFDLWVSASDNVARIQQHHLEDKIIPIHGDALNMPFAHDYFDAIVSVDAYHYFGCKDGIFKEKILPFLRRGGHAMIVVPGLKEEPTGDLNDLFHTWAEGDDADLFKTAAWWQNLLQEECGDQCEITIKECECNDEAWLDWYATGHEYSVRDREFLDQGLADILNFVLIYVKKK